MTENKSATWTQQLAEARAALKAYLAELTPEQWQTPVFSEGDQWTVATVVAHLVDGERGMSIQIHKTRKGEETMPAGFDLDRWNADIKKRMGEPSPSELMAALDEVRARTLSGLETLRDEEWSLQGRHPFRGIITIEQYYETMRGHDLLHLRDIRRALESAEAGAS